MIRVRRLGRSGPQGKVHLISGPFEFPDPLAYTALCGLDGGNGWFPIRDDVNLWGECIRCLTVKHNQAKAVTP